MCVFFYLPRHHLPSEERQAQWEQGCAPTLIQSGKSACAQCWIYQTWIELRDRVDIRVVPEMPATGTIVTLSNLLPPDFRAGSGQFVAAIVADFLPHPGAQLQIVQNLAHARRLPHSAFLPLWPQPDLLPRDPGRGGRVETLAFFGDEVNLAPELRSAGFAETLRARCGARLEIRGADRWNDYRDVDVAVAVRDFGRAKYFQKPATKLYNAWLADTPLIGGNDSAFRAEGAPGKDYLVAGSAEEFLSHVRALQTDAGRYQGLVEAGRSKVPACSREAVKARWEDFLLRELPARARRWRRKGAFGKKIFWPVNQLTHALDRRLRS